MARTINGKLTGRAAAEDRRDMRIYLSDQEDQLAAQRKERFIQVRDELKALDPTGWEPWYDEFVPDWRGWINVQPAIDCIAKRVEELRALAPVVAAPEPTPANSPSIQWRVASASTLRNYATAVKDFESVTGTKVKQASFTTLRQWHDSMIGRKYAQNTIRARLSVVRLMSNNTNYPLPPKIKYPATLLSLKDVRAVLAQANNAGEREALMKSLSGFDSISKHTAVTDFEAHYLGILKTTPTNTQALTRLLKRCAKKAGVEQTVSLRIWMQSGAWLLKVLSPVEFSKLMPIAETPLQNAKPLHGIGRRSHLVKS